MEKVLIYVLVSLNIFVKVTQHRLVGFTYLFVRVADHERYYGLFYQNSLQVIFIEEIKLLKTVTDAVLHVIVEYCLDIEDCFFKRQLM